MEKKKKIFPAKQPFEKDLEAMLGESEREWDYGLSLFTHKWEAAPHLKVQYWMMYDEAHERVTLLPQLVEGDDSPYGLTYCFDLNNNLMNCIDPQEEGFSYRAYFPDYHGPLDDEHTLDRRVPVITRKEFLEELGKIIKEAE